MPARACPPPRRHCRRTEMIEMAPRSGVMSAALFLALSSGCVAGPNYTRPPVPAPSQYRGVSAQRKSEVLTFGDQKWWDAFQDDALRQLIQSALQQNYD